MAYLESIMCLFELDTKEAEKSVNKLDDSLKNLGKSNRQAMEQSKTLGQDFVSSLNGMENKVKGVKDSIEQINQIAAHGQPAKFGIKPDLAHLAPPDIPSAIPQTSEMGKALAAPIDAMGDVLLDFGRNIGESMSQMKNATANGFKTVKQTAEETANVLGRSFLNVVDGVATAIATAGNHVHMFFQDIITSAIPKIKASAGSIGQSLGDVITGKLKNITGKFSFGDIFEGIGERAEKLSALGALASQSRIGVLNLDLLSRSAKSLGGNIDNARQDINNFSKSVTTALEDKGSDAASVFNKLGISLTNQQGKIKNTGNLIGELSQKMENLSQPQKNLMLDNLGIKDQGLRKYISTDENTRKQVFNEEKSKGIITQSDVAEAQEIQVALRDLNDTLDSAANSLIETLTPAFSIVLKGLKELVSFAQDNKIIMVAFFGALSVAAVSYGVSMASAAIATVAATWPILAIIGAVGALGLAIHNLIPFLKTIPKLFRDFVNTSPMVKAALGKLGAAWQALKRRAQPVITFFRSIWGIIASAWNGDFEGMKKNAWNMLLAIRKYFENIWNDIVKIVKNIAHEISEKLWNMLPAWAQRWLGKEGDAKRAEMQQDENQKQLTTESTIGDQQNLDQVAFDENQKQLATESTIAGQQYLDQVISSGVPSNAAEITKTQNSENIIQNNVSVESPNIVINAPGDSVEGMKKAANTFQRTFVANTCNGFDDCRQN